MWSSSIAILFYFADSIPENTSNTDHNDIKLTIIELTLSANVLVIAIAIFCIFNVWGFWHEHQRLKLGNSSLVDSAGHDIQTRAQGIRKQVYAAASDVAKTIAVRKVFTSDQVKEKLDAIASQNKDFSNALSDFNNLMSNTNPHSFEDANHDLLVDIDDNKQDQGRLITDYIKELTQSAKNRDEKFRSNVKEASGIIEEHSKACNEARSTFLSDVEAAEKNGDVSEKISEVLERLDELNRKFSRLDGSISQSEKFRFYAYELTLPYLSVVIALTLSAAHFF